VVVESATAGQLYAIGGAHYHYISDSVYDTARVDFYKNGSHMTEVMEYIYHPENGTVDFDMSPLNEFEKITANYTITSKFTSIEAFERHFDRRPYLDSINYTFFPDDLVTTEVDEATDGAIKAMIDQFVDFIGFPLEEGSQNVVRWEGDPDQKKLFDPFLVPHVLVQTKNPTFKFLYLGMNTEFTPLDDPLFRRGISMSIKRELANDYIPTAVIADSVIHPSNRFWYNESIDKFRVPKDEDGNTIYTDIINHFQDSGYLDPDEDGFMENLTGADFKLRLFVPLSAEDPSASSIGQDIGQTFNDVGIDAETIYAETSTFMNDVVAGDFELYLTTYEVEADPIFLYDILHKDNIPPPTTERNYVRLDNATMNSLLDNVRTQLDQDNRKEYVHSSLAWIASNAPLATILHFRVLEAYEKVSYEGWVQMTGGVNNFWSYLYVHYQQKGEMKAQFVIYVDSIDSGDMLEFGVSVTDMIDMPLEGAWVKVTNSFSDDVFINYTDSNGYAGFEWLAPYVVSPTTVDFTATVTIPQYDKVTVENSITVHPLLEKLEVTIGVTENRIKSGGETTVVVEVKDDFTGLGIPNATVILEIVRPENGPGSFAEFTGTTDANGRFETTFTADVTTSMKFTLKGTAIAEGYAPGTSREASSVFVDPIAQPTPGFEAVIVVLAVLLAVVLVGAWRGARSRKEEE
ncbi:MAG: ABC transporter substrate-binding protein, partial [Thermoplasmata archaeon]